MLTLPSWAPASETLEVFKNKCVLLIKCHNVPLTQHNNRKQKKACYGTGGVA
jgi:hypothetical protein